MNYGNQPRYQRAIGLCAEDRRFSNAAREVLATIAGAIVAETAVPALIKKLELMLLHTPDEDRAATRVWDMFKFHEQRIGEILSSRAGHIWSQIKDHTDANATVLDYGCGDGEITRLAACELPDAQFTQYDLIDYRLSRTAHPKIRWMGPRWDPKDLKGSPTTTWLNYVLHHAEEPDSVIERVSDVTSHQLIVLESVLVEDEMPWHIQWLADWVYNRGLHPDADIDVPGNFDTVDGWQHRFGTHGWHLTHSEELGRDLPIVPEHHHLMVFERNAR